MENIQLRDPLRTMLESGPFEPVDLLDHQRNITTWIDEGEFDDDEFAIRRMLEQLEERKGILIPHWWQATVVDFLLAFDENYEPSYKPRSITGKPWTLEERQLLILETLLYLWRQERDKKREEQM